MCRGTSQHTIAELLRVSASTQITNKLGLTPLAEAILSGQLDNARLLLGKVLAHLLPRLYVYSFFFWNRKSVHKKQEVHHF